MSDSSPSSRKQAPHGAHPGNRLAKVMARHGICSRRQAEQWIRDGRVKVNGSAIRTPALNVTEKDEIEVDGQPLAQRQGTRVWLYHKPAGLVVTERDPEGRPTIFEELARRNLPRVLSIGRLDINTEGLLLLTNDGGLKRTLELPATGWLRRYRVRAHGRIDQKRLDTLKEGLTHQGVRYGPIVAVLEKVQGGNVWMNVALKEGKNREIKNVMAALGLKVNRLIRTSFGPFQLGDIPVGGLDTVKARVLQDQLGKKLARQAGVDFEAPMPDPIRPDPEEGSRRRSPARKAPQGGKRRQEGTAETGSARPRSAPMGTGPTSRGRRPAADAERKEPEKEMRKVHFAGGRSAELFEPRARSKRFPAKGPGKDRKQGADRRSSADAGRDRPRGHAKTPRPPAKTSRVSVKTSRPPSSRPGRR